MATMRAVQVSRPGGPFEMVERPIPEPGAGAVRIKVRACGICHSDALTKEGGWPGIQYPRVPGHEVAGTIDAVGPGVVGWEEGQPAGVGWNGGEDGRRGHRRPGGFFPCVAGPGAGITYEGGYAEDPIAPPRRLGAAGYIDSQAQDPAAELQKLGGAAVILATATSGEAIGAVQGGLAINGTLMIVGAAPSLQVSPVLLLSGRRSVKGWYSGTSIDTQDTLAFSVRAGVRSMNETFPLERAYEAYERMMSGKARFRVVLTIGR